MEKELLYDIKCRKCAAITRMFFGKTPDQNINVFHIWAREHATFPIEKQCACDNGSIMFHDIISFTPPH